MNESELVFTQILNCSRQDLYLDRDRKLDQENSTLIFQVFKERVSGKPIQYILGKTEFMGLEFKIIPGVFIPRPETEILVETAIKVIQSSSHPVTKLKILDIGTGSGCIAVSLANLLPDMEITATDISPLALEITKENAKLNDVNINFLESDLFASPDLRPIAYNLIVSNPPYITTSEIAGLAREVRYQPRIALDGGSDGLNFYRRIIKDSPAYLEDNGHLILEMGFTQRKAIEKIAQASGRFSLVRVVRDYKNIERVVVLKKAGVGHG